MHRSGQARQVRGVAPIVLLAVGDHHRRIGGHQKLPAGDDALRDLLTVLLANDIAIHRGEGNRLAVSDETRAKAVLKREFGVNDQNIIDINYAEFKEQTPVNAEIDIEGARAIIVQIAKPGASQKLEDYTDLTLLNALKSQGFFEVTAPK